MDTGIEAILHFWFGDGDPDDPANAKSALWFGGGAELDRTIRDRFGAEIEEAALGRLEGWKQTPRGRLAWTLLLDQFTRNAYRDTPRMYAFDAMALQSTREAMLLGEDRALPVVHRAFLYLPLEHAEEVSAQEACVAGYRALVAEAPPAMKALMEGMLDYAERHAVVVRRFGRFPHRNVLLCRKSTPEEVAFLASDDAPF